jgi:hypothetical protein
VDSNTYICQSCKGSIVTRYDNVGVTPFMLRCRATRGCQGMMQSQFGKIKEGDITTHEWFRRVDVENMNPDELQHHLQGGAFIRRIDEEPACTLRKKRPKNPLLYRGKRHRR